MDSLAHVRYPVVGSGLGHVVAFAHLWLFWHCGQTILSQSLHGWPQLWQTSMPQSLQVSLAILWQSLSPAIELQRPVDSIFLTFLTCLPKHGHCPEERGAVHEAETAHRRGPQR